MVAASRKAPEERVTEINPKRPDIYGDAHPKELLNCISEDHDVLKVLANQHILSSSQFDRQTLLQLFRLAAKFESNPHRFVGRPLESKILISAFYEPSTRTRLSFESAWHRLGGDIMSITDRSTLGIAKGESLADVGEMFNNYGDCVVLRDVNEDSVDEMVGSLTIPIINAGNGMDEHPTQAMSDVYTIMKWRPTLTDPDKAKPIRVGIIGVPSRMRTVRSLLTTMSRFSYAFEEVVVVHDGAHDPIFSQGQLEALEGAGLNVRVSQELDRELPNFDVTYINAIAWVKDDFEVMGQTLRLNEHSPLKPDSIILHPLARGDELSPALDDTPHNWYFSQARGAVFVRMALLTCMVQRTDMVMDVL